MVESGREKILIMEGDESSRQRLEELLQGAGYAVSTADTCQDGLKVAQDRAVDLLVLDPNLHGLSCSDLLAEMKGASATAGTRVIVLVSGSPEETVRNLDLGADDVIARPWESIELLARVRTQLRAKKAQDELREQMQIAEQGQQVLGTAFQALAVTEKMTRDAFSLSRALKVGLGAVFVVVAVMAAIYYRFSRRANTEAQRSYAVIARLNRGLENQQALMERARKLSEQLEAQSSASTERQKQQLEQQSRELRERMAQASSDQASELRTQLQKTQAQLKRVESEGSVAENIIRSYTPSVCLLHVAVAFRDKASGHLLRYVGLLPDGEPIHDSKGDPLFTLEGNGPEARADFLGTGFLVSADGRIVTNHHVVEPWWENDDLASVIEQGIEPHVAEMAAYFPGSPRAYAVGAPKISAEADLAVVRGELGGLKREVLALDGRKSASVSGEPVVLMGYATGLDAVLARADDSTAHDIVTASRGNPDQILAGLAKKNLIRPLVTQGHIGDVLPDKIVYDAQTTSGGSGGPLFNPQGKVIGINYAVLVGFGGSNFGIPVRYAERLLAQ